MKSLDRLLNPSSIAVFGGSWAKNVIGQLIRSKYKGKIWWVHPTRKQMDGVEWFAGVEELPAAPDAAFIGVNREITVFIVQALSKMNAGGVCCFASGFLESEAELAGGADLQKSLISAAGDMPVLGPNCYGYLNYLDNVTVWPDEHGGVERDTGVAILTQSSNIAISFSMQQRGLPIGCLITTGNQAVVGMASIAENLLDDDRITAIGMHVEGYRDIQGFEAMATKAKKLGKPIVVFKVGKSAQAQVATVTHTASLAGSMAGANAFARRLGFVAVESIPVFLETLKLLHHFGPLPGNNVASISCSGGEASIMADAAVSRDLNYKPFSSNASKKLKNTLGSLVTIANPLDYHTYIWGDFERMRDTYAAVIEDEMDLSFFVLDMPRADRCIPEAWYPAIESLKAAVKQTGGRVAVVPSMHENLSESLANDLAENGIVTLYGVDEAHSAVEAAYHLGHLMSEPIAEPLFRFETQSKAQVKFRTLDEYKSKIMLRDFGLAVPHLCAFESAEDLSRAELDLKFPVAIKARGLAHKSETNAVVLNISDRGELTENAIRLSKVGDGLLVEEMVENVVAELIVGVMRDEAHGMLLTIGAGGLLTELLADTACLLLPTSPQKIQDALNALKIKHLLAGYRGMPPGDIEATIKLILEISRFALSMGNDLEEMDINPLMVCERDAIIADALIVIRRRM